MEIIKCNVSTPYTITIDNDIFKNINFHFSSLVIKSKVMIVTDANVGKLYAATLVKTLKKSGFDAYIFSFKAGEKSKNLKTYQSLMLSLSQNKFSKTDIILGFGGGVACDIAGFAASTYLRGIRLVMIPTSILAAVDASIGGKNGVDFENIKNQIGTIYQPLAVFIDPKLFSTLKKKNYNEGFAEIIKYSIIENPNISNTTLFDILESKDEKNYLEKIIAACVLIKAKIVEKDEKDDGIRQVLNLGHTIGHAIEYLSNYKITHGEAVALGIEYISNASVKSLLLSEKSYKRIIKTLENYSLLRDFPIDKKSIKDVILHDKKIRNSYINFIVPEKIGKVKIDKISLSDIDKFLDLAFS